MGTAGKPCAKSGCGRIGTHHIEVRIWALGHPKTHEPMTAKIGLTFCRDHARAEAASGDLLTEAFWTPAEQLARSTGRLPPDRASAECVVVRGDGDAAIDDVVRKERH